VSTDATIGSARDWPGASVAARASRSADQPPRSFLFWPLMLFFVLEYARPSALAQLRLQMMLLLLFLVVWALREDRAWSRNLSLQLAFLGLCAASGLWALNHFSVYVTVRTVAGHVIVATTITWILSNRRDISLAIWIWVGIMSYQAVHAIFYGGRGTGGFLGDENDLALACSTALPFALVASLALPGWRRWLGAGLSVLLTAAIVVSVSRGGFVGLVAAVLYCVMASRNRVRNLAIGALGVVAFVLMIPSSYNQEIESMRQTSTGTAETRLFLWAAAMNTWIDHPLLGVGAGNYPWNVGRYQPKGRAEGLFSAGQYHQRDFTTQVSHSAFMQVLAETGLVGSLLFAALLTGHFRGLRSLRRRQQTDLSRVSRSERDAWALALEGSMVAFLAGGAFLSVAYYPYPWYLTALAVAWQRAAGAPAEGGTAA
jgi:O-antigen ligase